MIRRYQAARRAATPALAERLTLRLPWRGENTELLHEAKHVCFEPLFHKLAVHDPVDVSAGNAQFLPRRWDSLKLPPVLEPIGIADDHHVASAMRNADETWMSKAAK